MKLWAIEYQLVNAAPEYVFEWLKNNVLKSHSLSDENREQLEKSLLVRNHKLINLGLALYGEVASVGYLLFKSDDLTIKRAALSGRSVRPFLGESWVFNNDVIPNLLEQEKQNKKPETISDDKTLLHELLSNKFLPTKVLENVYNKSGNFSDVDDDLWITMVAMSARNERLATPNNSNWIDGSAMSEYDAVFSAAWRLFKVFPVNKKAAYVLSDLSDQLVPNRPNNMKVLDVIERWRSNDKDEDETYSNVRTALVKIIGWYSKEFKSLKDHPDLALRRGYYANLHLVKPEDVFDGFNKGGNDFLSSAIDNDSFYKNEETRNALEQACEDAPDEYPATHYRYFFNSNAEYLFSKHPEWFKESWSEIPRFEEIEDITERQEKRLAYLNTQVAELYKTLINEEEDEEPSESNHNDINLLMKFEEITKHLNKLHNNRSFSWGYLIIGVMLGFIIGKY